MTLIIALNFRDGIVMAADSLGTEAVVGHPLLDFGTTVEKVHSLGPNIVWGGSGGGGLTQRVKDELDDWAGKNSGLLDRPANDICPRLAKVVQDTISRAFDESPFKQRPEAGPDGLKNAYLLAGQSRNGATWLLEVLWNGEKTRYEERGFHAIGSARIYAYAAHGMIQHYGLRQCDSRNALICAYRILDFGVKAAASGVREPYIFWIVENSAARQLPGAEVFGLRETVGLWLEKEKEALTATQPLQPSS